MARSGRSQMHRKQGACRTGGLALRH